MRTRPVVICEQLKRKNSVDELLGTKRKKLTTNLPSTLGDQVGEGKELKGTLSARTLKTDRKSKRNLSSISRNQIRNRKRRKMEKVDGNAEAVESVDRISELPEHITHHILSFLRCPKDVTRTAVLSKKWRTIWASFFTFDFDQRMFQSTGGDCNKKFITFVQNSLGIKLELMHSIQKFKLYLTNMNLHVSHWISSAAAKNIRELEIHVQGKKKRCFYLPDCVLTSKTLTSLKLYGCKFDNQVAVDLCHLKELSIKNTSVNADTIQNFIRGCPLVEDLRLIYCTGLSRLHISNLVKLYRVELHECNGLRWIDIRLPSLRSFVYCGKKSWICEINLAGCENLKCLTLKNSNLTDELFQDQISGFPNLEKLVLKECNLLKRITILSLKLKELSLIQCKQLKEADIDAPNLSALEYAGDKIPFQSMPMGLHEVKFHMESASKNNHSLIRELQQFLSKFVNNEPWKMLMSSNKNITIHEEWKRISFQLSDDLNLDLTKSSVKMKEFVDNSLRMSHPKSLSLLSSSSSEFLKFLKEKILSREENPNCCRYYSRKCWLHSIKDVTANVKVLATEVSEEAENKETSQNLQLTTFKFNWKPVKQRQ